MKNYILLPLFVCTILSFSGSLAAQDNSTGINTNEASAITPSLEFAKNTDPGFTDNIVFPNYNLTINGAPQNEPSVRISRVNPNFFVAAWRDFRLGYINPNIERRIGYTYSTNGG